ncbi:MULTISPECIES: alpha/beta hydrolase [Amycolatopsis]|uniref:Alpha/beta fold hydrolase n=1 Tax=Amycolatopsis dendrobii TaxID=2760662 RepID=A0A7W3VTJ1_9PSEU|nr:MULTISPECIES: alpha/beta hydrolase [Amycolatopsis]MBB1152946.1 alpha/beta fold hydrolase [Amycolatopsis dendrobii]UKD51889.1 alpha/beta hydrolase [Amycolatopsis sp. FU40]
MRKILLVAAVAASVATAVVPAASAATAIKWEACPADANPGPGLECATLKVPLNYQDPNDRTIDLAISRLPSKNPEKRRGVLLLNPGGPGGEGLGYPSVLSLQVPGIPSPMPKDVLESYDLIGFDPRGVGHSSPVTCDLTPEQMAIGNLPYANGPRDVVKQAAVAKAEAKQCADAKTGWMLPYTTTANAARDMDRIREALGEQKISYVGASYGTYLGAVYTTMYPQRSDRIVLDSNLGPGGYDIDAMHGFGRGIEDRFPDFAKYAAANPQYGLGSTPAQATAKFYDLVGRLDRHPVAGITGGLLRGAAFSLTYSDFQFKKLAAMMHDLDQGKEPAQDGPAASENTFASRFAVICGDSSWPKSIGAYQVNVALDRVRYPLIGAGEANIAACAYWAAPVEQKVRITGRGPSNVLMVQNTRDPGTPLANARKLRAAFGDRARMVTVDQGGHGAYVFAANKCGNNAVNEFLATGKRPAADVFCAA